MRTLVLGAGVIGITTAYYLARQGNHVTVIERGSEAGVGSSRANGGQISISHPEPWASPELPWKLLRWFARVDAPVRVRPRLDPAMWRWLFEFLRNCTAQRRARHAGWIAHLALYSREALAALRAQEGIEFEHRSSGTLHVFTETDELEHARRLAAARRKLGIEQQLLDAQGCTRIEPALATATTRIEGGIYAPGDESGDAFLFTQRLAALCAARGVDFHYDSPLEHIASEGDEITGVITTSGRTFTADNYVLALGAQTPRLAQCLRLRIPIYPVKGYSISLPVGDTHTAPTVNIIHEARRVVTSRVGSNLRIAGMADIVGYDDSVHSQRAQAVLSAALELFPNPGAVSQANYWAGLRPMTPDGLPLLGSTPYSNLYLNCGQGSLGWTLACGSARALAALVCTGRAEIELEHFSLSRFR